MSADYKNGGKHDPENSHSISLISIFWKIMESLMKENFLDFPRKKMSDTNGQYGFLPGRSAILQLLNVFGEMTEVLDSALMFMLYIVTSRKPLTQYLINGY